MSNLIPGDPWGFGLAQRMGVLQGLVGQKQHGLQMAMSIGQHSDNAIMQDKERRLHEQDQEKARQERMSEQSQLQQNQLQQRGDYLAEKQREFEQRQQELNDYRGVREREFEQRRQELNDYRGVREQNRQDTLAEQKRIHDETIRHNKAMEGKTKEPSIAEQGRQAANNMLDQDFGEDETLRGFVNKNPIAEEEYKNIGKRNTEEKKTKKAVSHNMLEGLRAVSSSDARAASKVAKLQSHNVLEGMKAVGGAKSHADVEKKQQEKDKKSREKELRNEGNLKIQEQHIRDGLANGSIPPPADGDIEKEVQRRLDPYRQKYQNEEQPIPNEFNDDNDKQEDTEQTGVLNKLQGKAGPGGGAQKGGAGGVENGALRRRRHAFAFDNYSPEQ